MELYDYQNKLICDIREAIDGGKKSVLAVAPTGAGKTIVFATIAKMASLKNRKVLVLVHRREILHQTMIKLFAIGVNPGQVASGKPMTRRNKVQVAMVSTLVNRLHILPKPDLIIIDEAHHAVAGSWKRVFKYYGDVPRIGFTATPERLDGRGLGEIFDHLCEAPGIYELVKKGRLSYPLMYRPPQNQVLDFHMKRGDYDKKEQEMQLGRTHVIGDVVKNYKKLLDGLPTIAFCATVRHCQLVADMFNKSGYRAEVVSGTMSNSARDKAIAGLGNGSVNIICSCDVISEGVDIPIVAGCILLRKTASLAVYLQQVGRALRVYDGKKHAIIIDHVGNRYMHGHVLQPRKWSLDAQKRSKRDKNANPDITECPKCFGVWGGKIRSCPACGYSFVGELKRQKIEELKTIASKLQLDDYESEEGELIHSALQAQNGKERAKILWREAYKLQHDADGKRKLNRLATGMGYKDGWSHIVWQKIIQKRGKA